MIVGGGTYGATKLAQRGTLGKIAAVILGIPVIVYGLLILEGEQQIMFSKITAQEAKDLGLTQSETISFNHEVDQVNALAAHVNDELVSGFLKCRRFSSTLE